jgi:Fe-S cluster assembly protein SufB
MAKKTTKVSKPGDNFIKDQDSYEHGYSFNTKDYAFQAEKGLDEAIVKKISGMKQEPDWMLKNRLAGFKEFQNKKIPSWGPDLSDLKLDDLSYYLKPTDQQARSWDDVPPEVKETFERIGVPEAERAHLAGVKAQYDSEIIYGSLKQAWEKDGVIFVSIEEGLSKHPELFKKYFGTVIPNDDNKYAALNTAVWSGGSFVYIPPGVHVKMPLQTYFRINSESFGQFERTLIIVDEGASVHYVEGCFTAETEITTDRGIIPIKDVLATDKVLTHAGRVRSVGHTQIRKYSGELYEVKVTGNIHQVIEATEEHPFLVVKRIKNNERNKKWKPEWLAIKNVTKGDYVCTPIDRLVKESKFLEQTIKMGAGRHGFSKVAVKVPLIPEFFRLIGYYLAEGSISSGHYLNFSFGSYEREYIDDVKRLIKLVFNEDRIRENHHKTNNGTSVVVSSTKLCRIFEQFGTSSSSKQVPKWVMQASPKKQSEVILGWYRGDGNYYNKQLKHGLKEIFRGSTTSKNLVYQMKQILLRLDIACGINKRVRKHEGRQTMFNLVIGGEYMVKFGELVGQKIEAKINGKKRATFYYLDDKYLYSPVNNISKTEVKNIDVYNFSVKQDESYVANGVAVHNCTAPQFASSSLHSGVVEIIVKKGATCQYTTVQNWYKNIYNLVTQRAYVHEDGKMVWTDFNMGSQVTMKYPGYILAGKGAKGEVLSMALAGHGQHQDTGAKAIHLAPYTSSTIISKSISKGGGRASYRGLVYVAPEAHHSKNTVVCDALILDGDSRSDTYPVDKISNNQVEIQHEATVSKVGDDQLFYLMSRGVSEENARKMIVNGFIADLVRKLPLEYAVEMNRLIDFEMEGSVG